MWKRSYGTQIGIAQAKCFEAIVRMDGKIAVSFPVEKIRRLFFT